MMIELNATFDIGLNYSGGFYCAYATFALFKAKPYLVPQY
jgi:hypothetical protein